MTTRAHDKYYIHIRICTLSFAIISFFLLSIIKQQREANIYIPNNYSQVIGQECLAVALQVKLSRLCKLRNTSATGISLIF